MTEFDPRDTSTWPLLLTPEQFAAIKQRSVGGIKKLCQLGRCIPAPCEKHPYRWRRADVLRYVEGARTVSHLRRSA